jgi:hypothetical protein
MQLSEKVANNKYTNAADKNILALAELNTEFSELSKPPEEYFQFDKEREDICLKYVERKNGEPVVENNNYKITENSKEDFKKEMAGLESKFPDLKTATDKHQAEIMAWLDEEVESIPLRKINSNDCPDMTTALRGKIRIMVEEDSVISQPGKMFDFKRK